MTALSRYQPQMLSIMRIMVGLLFLQHGTQKFLYFPTSEAAPGGPPELFALSWFGGIIEFVGGALVAAGLFTRYAAFLCSGMMAVGYFLIHAPNSFFPILNRGDAAILYCFAFLYIVVAGPGPWSVDALLQRDRRVPAPAE